MANVVQQDTPIRRASLSELSMDQVEKLIEDMRERRMRSYTMYELAKAAKEKIKLEKDRARYDKLLDMAERKIESVDKGLEALSKYVNELRVLELVLGE